MLLDFVVNHVSSAHAAFRRAQADRDGARGRAGSRFTRWPDEYETFFGVRDHPRIDSDDPGAREYLIEAAASGSTSASTASGATTPTARRTRSGARSARPRAPPDRTASRWARSSRRRRSSGRYAGRLDGCLDFLLMQALRRFFAFRESTAGELDAFLRRHLAFFGDGLALPSFLDNHDMNRFLWVVGGDARRLRLAALCQFALPGPPIVYYGTELGLSQRRDVRYADGSGHPEESRLPMPWGEARTPSLLAFYVELGRLRRATAGLWRAPREVVALDDGAGLYAWRCDDGAAAALVALNNGDGEWRSRWTRPPDGASPWPRPTACASPPAGSPAAGRGRDPRPGPPAGAGSGRA